MRLERRTVELRFAAGTSRGRANASDLSESAHHSAARKRSVRCSHIHEKQGLNKMDQNENPASRWTTDPGAIPGEPDDYLDIPIGEDGEIGEAKAVIVEIETPGGSRWEARAFGGRFLGMFETAEQARTAAQTYVDKIE